MANRTATEAQNIHGTNPQFLIEKIIRTRIYDSIYWKESCFALTAETLIDKAVSLTSIGGQYGNQKPTDFLCLALKMLQLQPEKDIVRLYIQNEDYKYLRALGAFYLRLTGTAVEIYQYLEPLLLDYRKLRRRNISGEFELTHVDEFVDDLLRSERVCDTILPRITKRHILEENGDLEPRLSPLEEDLEDEEIAEDSKGEISSDGEKIEIADEIEGVTVEVVVVVAVAVEGGTDTRPNGQVAIATVIGPGLDHERDQEAAPLIAAVVTPRETDTAPHATIVAGAGKGVATVEMGTETITGGAGRVNDNEESRSVSEGIKKKPSVSSKKVNALFKKTAVQAGESTKKAGKEGGGGASESLSVEETNKMRVALGLKPLKM
ncbi:hypothetical protein SpCBS45565_g02062 [Spizellomyces sp. 'palustris']|nr:hypothetical protein SpCBS45565_g02062 [Spizellomyces sp. 'palustris']